MEIKQDKDFDNLMEAYKKLKLIDKQKIVENELKEILATFEKLFSEKQQQAYMIYNREILDTSKEHTEDDFSESIYVYINAIKECLANYILLEKEKRD